MTQTLSDPIYAQPILAGNIFFRADNLRRLKDSLPVISAAQCLLGVWMRRYEACQVAERCRDLDEVAEALILKQMGLLREYT